MRWQVSGSWIPRTRYNFYLFVRHQQSSRNQQRCRAVLGKVIDLFPFDCAASAKVAHCIHSFPKNQSGCRKLFGTIIFKRTSMTTCHQKQSSPSSSWRLGTNMFFPKASFLISLGLLLVLSPLSSFSVLAQGQEQEQVKPDDFGIFAWIHEHPDGYFNPKQEFRYEIPNDPSSVAGIFATERIEEGELLCKVPWELVLKSDDPTEEGQLCCGTVAALARAMRDPSTSKFEPYARYLNAQDDGQLPSAWSQPGKKLVQKLVGGKSVVDTAIPPGEPTEWLTHDWYQRCGGSPNDELSAKAALLVVQRSDDYFMIPGYDMYNHRNGKNGMNTETNTKEGISQETKATRTIEPGEQIYISYNQCNECPGRKIGYGTAEIFRDYGFIEDYPQRWHFLDTSLQFDVDKDINTGRLSFRWSKWKRRPDDDDLEIVITWLQRQVRRLRRIRNMDYGGLNSTAEDFSIPSREWDTAWEFQRATIVAMQLVTKMVQRELKRREKTSELNHLPTAETGTAQPTCTTATSSSNLSDGKESCRSDNARKKAQVLSTATHHYDDLGYEYDDLDYIAPTCDNDEIMMFHDYNNTEQLRTTFQQLNFAIHPDDGDVCMDLDDIVQICSCYRPHYHEYVVHAAARFIDTVKRVIFIGGGDSMLLHEILKYPSLELVVGLELDQIVTRKSFKYFHTQPHFDDDRVEWWFGDATKSLLILPEEYWGSFDLVLVDLSETVMSFSVTNELDVFGALSLLLQPDGVMVKNELYMDPMSEVFDYTTQIFYESPIICSQALAMGSNSVDFFHAAPKDHGVPTLLYESLHTPENHLDLLHDYRKNDAREQGKCNESLSSKKSSSEEEGEEDKEPTEQERSAGVMEIIDLEQVGVTQLSDSLLDTIVSAIEKEGFTLASMKPIVDRQTGTMVIVMKEGYIVSHLFATDKYVALEVNLWGRFDKLSTIKKILIDIFQTDQVSSYRVVVGGMYGSNTWKEDYKMIGPKAKQLRNCRPEIIPESTSATSVKKMVEIATKESLNLYQGTTGSTPMALVICGVDGIDECNSYDMLVNYYSNSDIVIPLWTCSELNNDDDMYRCEKQIIKTIEEALMQSLSMLDIVVVDTEVSYPMLQLLNSILSVDGYRKKWIRKHNLFVAISTSPTEEVWRRNFLDRYRKQYEKDPVARGQFLLQTGDISMEVGVVVTGDDLMAYHLKAVEKNMSDQYRNADMDVKVQLVDIREGLFPYIDDFQPNKFLQSDYDNQPAIKQMERQKFLARQNIFQLEPKDDKKKKTTMSMTRRFNIHEIQLWLEKSLKHAQYDITSQSIVDDVGDGNVLSYVSKQGTTVMLVWDGREHVDINIWTYGESPGFAEKLVGAFSNLSSKAFKVKLRDDQPRGTGGVILLPSELSAFKINQEKKS